ncbi:MAG TPA: hypothetical protein VGD67_28405 [Pseudonocardiaceae bacterium]
MDPHTLIITVAVALALLVTLSYVASCAIWPFTACRRCSGAGKRRAPLGRAFRHCPRCQGTGHRLRLGRRAWNTATRINRELRTHRTDHTRQEGHR